MMMSFQKVKAPRSFGSEWYTWTDIDGKTKTIAHIEWIDGKMVETKEYKEMKRWTEEK